jgi:hypothetical protein
MYDMSDWLNILGQLGLGALLGIGLKGFIDFLMHSAIMHERD